MSSPRSIACSMRKTRSTSGSSTCRSRPAVYESYDSDPLTLAAKRLVDAGIVVVAAAGNAGRNSGRTLALRRDHRAGQRAVGADGRRREPPGHVDRADDTVAIFSSRGPAMFTQNAKPDLVAPGVGIESLATPEGTLYTTRAAILLAGTVSTPICPT